MVAAGLPCPSATFGGNSAVNLVRYLCILSNLPLLTHALCQGKLSASSDIPALSKACVAMQRSAWQTALHSVWHPACRPMRAPRCSGTR